jgi:hypothetical protein
MGNLPTVIALRRTALDALAALLRGLLPPRPACAPFGPSSRRCAACGPAWSRRRRPPQAAARRRA